MPFQAPHKPLPSNKSLKQKQKQLQEQNKHEKMKPAL
ncbi:DNA replication protein DnaD [Bacillus thuringiensis]|nr:DNA replication protein DnaD [Bacillus thuringiensis]PFF27632.1 DNA replication protein DnaD [Bacillus thuringiensis]PFT10199.1 DNA replication protein DnaD [Bacillus thuringiensis]